MTTPEPADCEPTFDALIEEADKVAEAPQKADPRYARIRGYIVDEIGKRCGQIPDIHPRLLEGINTAARMIADEFPTEPASLSLMGDVIVAEVNECTCGSGGGFQHEPYCGVEPYLFLKDVKNADLIVECGVREEPWVDTFRIFTDEEKAKAFALEQKAIVYTRHVLRGRF